MSERHKVIPAVYLFITKADKVFLMRRAHTRYFNGYYSLPAGHVEAGELPTDAIVREAKEEAGIEILKSDVRFVHAIYRAAHDSTGERVDYFFVAEEYTGEPKVCEPDKCDDGQWFDVNQLPPQVVPEVKQALVYYQNEEFFSEMPFSEKNVNPDDEKK